MVGIVQKIYSSSKEFNIELVYYTPLQNASECSINLNGNIQHSEISYFCIMAAVKI